MTALRRTVRINGGPMRPLDLNVMCDQCNKSRAHAPRPIQQIAPSPSG